MKYGTMGGSETSPPQGSKSVTSSNPAAAGITVEHRVSAAQNASSARGALIFGVKPAMALLGAYGVLATAGWGFLLPYSLSLSEQVDRLEREVDRLGSEVDRLEDQVDRFRDLNDELEAHNEEFARQNAFLNASNVEYAEQNDKLNQSIAVLGEQNDILNASNAEYARLNAQLNETRQKLEVEVDELEAINANLTVVANEYAELNDKLSANVDRLKGHNENLTEQVALLNASVTDLESENDRLSDLNDDLSTILSFIQEEAENVEETYEALAAYLAAQININRGLIIDRMSITYQQMTTSWVCGLDLTFRGRSFMEDPNSPIGPDAYPDVVVNDGLGDGYVEEEVLTELCLDNTDFELYLSNATGAGTIPPVNVTVNQLYGSVSDYTTAALDYYFPDNLMEGLNDTDWAEADYDCKNLPPEKQFVLGI